MRTKTLTHTALLTADLEALVEFTYIPGCPAVLNPVDKAHPEEPAEVELQAVYPKGDLDCDILEILSDEAIDRLETDILENWEGEEPDERG